MTYSQAEEYLLNIPKFTAKNEPEKTKAFLQELGDFSDTIPTVHVAGTNGKGSVCAYLRAGLEANGLKVGMFTSPHLVSMRERFMINEEMISEREFVNTFNYVQTMVEEMRKKDGFCAYHPTFFEFLFFMAVVWFKNKRPDVIILETGLGGRLDATNSISSPKVCVITEIGLDHCEYLGNTKEDIAYEKAGIIKPGVPVVHFSKNASFDDVIMRRAEEMGSKAFFISRENIKNLVTSDAGIDFSMQSLYDGFVEICLHTQALYQAENASVSYETLRVLSEALPGGLDRHKCLEGFRSMIWPGRMEKISERFVIDGGHNEDGINAFLESVSVDKAIKRNLLYSAVSDKNVEAVAGLIKDSGLFSKIVLCTLDSYRAADIERLKASFVGACEVITAGGTAEGLKLLLSDKDCDMHYAVGSLYLVGEIKALYQEGT